jgi:hypothetical protein
MGNIQSSCDIVEYGITAKNMMIYRSNTRLGAKEETWVWVICVSMHLMYLLWLCAVRPSSTCCLISSLPCNTR